MCACRCGIRVHLKDGRIRYIEGNPDHPVNQRRAVRQGLRRHHEPLLPGPPHQAPAAHWRARQPATSRRSSGRRRWPSPPNGSATIRATEPRKLAFFTGRDQSQSFTGWWAKQFGTPNFAAHGGFCSVNMAAAGLYTVGGSFWEFGDVDWDRTKYLLMFGVAEDHDSNPIKLGIAKLKERGAKFVSVNPVKTGYSAVADEWIGIRPGTDGLFVLSLVHELLSSRPHRPGFPGPLHQRRLAGRAATPAAPTTACSCAMPTANRWPGTAPPRRAIDAATPGMQPQIVGEHYPARRPSRLPRLPPAGGTLPGWPLRAGGGGGHAAASRRRPSAASPPSWPTSPSTRRSSSISPGPTHPAGGTRRCSAARWRCTRCAASPRIPTGSTPAAPFTCCKCCWAPSILRAPGATSRRSPGRSRPVRSPSAKAAKPNAMLPGMALGNPRGPEDLLLEDDGTPVRIDKAFTWDAPMSAHGLMHMVIANAHARDPYHDRHAVHVHGQHGVELVDEPRRGFAQTRRQGPCRRLSHSARHLR